jgi:class 3 adenylate cyclase
MDLMERTDYRTHCPFKGNASYWTLNVADQSAENTVWSYEDPLPEAESLRGYVAFYRNRMDSWYEEEEEVSIDPVTDTHAHGNPLIDWLMRDAWEAATTSELVARFARQLLAVGVPVFRLNLMVRTLHPQVMGRNYVWLQARDSVEENALSHDRAQEERFLGSPFAPIFEGRGGVRRRLEGDDAQLDFPILRDLRNQGATDYVAMPLTFSDGRIHALTLSTRRPGGFETRDLGHIHEILPIVSRLVEVHVVRHTARTLLDTYLGAHAGERVLNGLIRRGDGEEIQAVIWWADLRGSTALTERLPRQQYLGLLNDFFESTAGSVIEQGGEVLKFIGDAVLAIFPIGKGVGARRACRRALAAGMDAQGALAAVNRRRAEAGQDRLSFGLALHLGDVMLGNIGVPERISHSVIGSTVNEVARLEALTKKLKRPVVASENFAAQAPGAWDDLGQHRLRGVKAPLRVFAPQDSAAAKD